MTTAPPPADERARPDPSELRAAMAEKDTLRPRDLARTLGVAEADLVAAQVGRAAVRIAADPDRLVPAVCRLGEVMALTRNESAVHERIGVYEAFRPGDHAATVLGPEIDLRIFPRHWVHAYALTSQKDKGPARSLQVFDASGDAVHKVYPRDGTDLDLWDRLVAGLATGDSADRLDLAQTPAPEGARSRADKAEALREDWRRMTDTHQFLRLVSKLKMNRLGAYRVAGAPFARPLAPGALDAALTACGGGALPVMLFVGNRGCIQIHSGPIDRLKPMGPWQNVLDPRFNLHLRADHVAEVWLVEKPTRRGPALSVEAFDDAGSLILQLFGLRRPDADDTPAFAEMANALPPLETVR